jgi:lipoteichoic acid synthase
MASAPLSASASRRILLEIGPLAVIIALLCWKLLYFSALLPGQWWLAMNDWWLTDQDPITGWVRPFGQIAEAVQARPHVFSATFAALLLLFAPLVLMPRACRLALLLVLDVSLTLLAVLGFLHYRFFGDVLSVSDLYVAHQLHTVVPSVIRQLHPIDALYFLEIAAGLLLFPLYVLVCRRIPGFTRRASRSLGLGMLALGLLLALPTARLIGQDEDGLFARTTLRYEVASSLGLLPYHVVDLALNGGPAARSIGPRELERVRRFLDDERQRQPPPSELFGVARGRNLILISAESLQAFPIGLEIDGQPVMPRFTAFAAESLYFDSFHDQTHLGTTSDAEFMALNSLHPLPARALANKFPEHHYRALPGILAEQGYATMSAVASWSGIWDMVRLHPRYGFQQSFFDQSYNIREYFGQWGSDREFFAQTMPFVEAQAEPFMAFLLSSANHHPYPIPPHHRVLRLGELEGTLLGDYLHSAHVFDQAFGALVDMLRERGLLDRSIVAVYGDHHGFLGDTPELARLLGFPEWSEYDHFRTRKKIPFLIRLPHGQHAGVMHVTAGHLDIAPTILGLLGVEDERRVMLGRDLLRDQAPLVVFRDGSFADGAHYFVNRLGPTSASSCYAAATGQQLDCEPLAERRRQARQRLEISDLIVEGDLIPALTAGEDRRAAMQAADDASHASRRP